MNIAKGAFVVLSLLLLGAGCASRTSPLDKEWLKLEQSRETRLRESELFDRKIICQDMVDKFKKRYNNVSGGDYNPFSNTCSIDYEIDGEKNSSDMELMGDK